MMVWNLFRSNKELQLKKDFMEQAMNKPERDADRKSLAKLKQRNHQIIKEIEMSKAKLRSLALYSPLETILKNAILNYKHCISESKQSE